MLDDSVVPVPAAEPAAAPRPQAAPDPAMVQRVTADVVAGTQGQPVEVQKQAAIAAVADVLAKTQPYTQVGQSLMGTVAVAGGVLALLGSVFGKAKAAHAKIKEWRTPKPVAANRRRRRRR
jgi:hypothetical protein